MIPFNRTKSVVPNGRHYDPESLKNKGIYFNQIKTEVTMDNINGSEKTAPQLFKINKPISKDGTGNMETDSLIDYIIKTHHDFAKKKSAIIYILAQKVFYRHSNTHPEMLTINNIIFLFLHDLLNQMKGEEQFLFPYIRQAANDIKYAEKNDNYILQSLMWKKKLLQNNHEKAFTYLSALRQVTDNFEIPPDCSNSYKDLLEKIKELEDDLILHFHLEDDLLFSGGWFIKQCL
jgi:regulator of cell morphogenesis and NO signaling